LRDDDACAERCCKGCFIKVAKDYDINIKFDMDKISIFGCTGSGKSFLAKLLGEILDLPVIHLDKFVWSAEGVYLDKEVMTRNVLNALGDNWVIDGNQTREDELWKLRMNESDTIILLDFNANDCKNALVARHGTSRTDFPSNIPETEEGFKELLALIPKWNEEKKTKILALIEKYNATKKLTILYNREQVTAFLNEIKTSHRKSFGRPDNAVRDDL